jgi:GNAT superfamily N-acetyltransferase
VLVRLATIEDAASICAVVRRSITELCVEDHHNDERILSQWLAGKTPDNVRLWLTNPRNINLLAVRDGAVLGASCVTTGGEIILNYVSPDNRFQGASSALLAAMEAVARGSGLERCVLDSTSTARRFYQNRGYVPRAAPSSKFGLTAWPLMKSLTADAAGPPPPL